ncbi:MAG: DUF5060 domain-containing protein [Armatimonadota bacterium]
MSETPSQETVEQWGMFELELSAHVEGNPFVDVALSATFSFGHREVKVDGFCEGDDTFRVRFSPDVQGEWQYTTDSNCPELDGKTGSFVCGPPGPGNHGSVYVEDTYHFAYADGTPYYQVGTTCYAWVHQGDELEEQTLETLKTAPFNKMRMCVFPKHYAYNQNEPEYFAYERGEDGEWDFTRFSPPFWRHLEQRVGQLMALGIEADLILFHPYDCWGFATMAAESDDRYLRYIVARLAAYRNVWWSLANEYDLMREKSMADWDRFFRIIQERDPYQRLRSVHNCRQFYDYGKPWVTHCSIQSSAVDRTGEWRSTYRKPVVIDECRYEGNIEQGWGNISAQEMVHRFWVGTVGGGYVGHGETYLHPKDILWWSKGGVLHGESPARIAFLRELLEDGPAQGFTPLNWGARGRGVGKGDEYVLFYFGDSQPGAYTFRVPNENRYSVEVIDTWEMTTVELDGTYSGTFLVPMPSKTGMAVRMRKVED